MNKAPQVLHNNILRTIKSAFRRDGLESLD